MPTLLQLNCTANWGSTGKIAEQIGVRAQQKGWKVYMAYGRKILPSSLQTICVGHKLSPYLHYAENRLLDHEGLGSRFETQRLIKKIQVIHPDVVHLHNIHDHWLNYKLLFEYLNRTDIKVVWTLHDCWSYTGGCSHYTLLNCNKWQTECKNCVRSHLLRDYSNQQFHLRKDLFTANMNLTLVSVSKWLEGEVRKSFLKDAHIQTILNGVDVNLFRPIKVSDINNKYNLHGKFVLVAAATAWSSAKGLEDYKVLATLLPSDCTLILIGLNEKQLRSLPQSIIGLPRTANVQELVEFYSRADVVMNLSYQESFGLTTVEGLACGSPSIVYNATASPELVTPETGIVVEPGDIHGVLSAILKIKQKGKVAYSTACRQRAEQYFDKNKNFEKYIQLYDELLKQ
jgi:glycosyltransferase involved in cell wall biosynthesis